MATVTSLLPKEVIPVIKMITAHPRIATTIIVGASVAAMFSMPGLNMMEAAQGIGGGMSRAYNWLKAAGVISVVAGLLFVMIKFDIIGLKMPPENSAFMVARRGRLVRDKSGAVLLYFSGRNRIHIANYRCLVPVHFGDRFVSLGMHEFTLEKVTWKREFTMMWRISPDVHHIEKIVTMVSDSNWWDGKFNQLTDAVREKATGQLADLLAGCTVDESKGIPVIDNDLAATLMSPAVGEYSCEFVELLSAPVSLTAAQQGKDGNVAIAMAIRPGDYN